MGFDYWGLDHVGFRGSGFGTAGCDAFSGCGSAAPLDVPGRDRHACTPNQPVTGVVTSVTTPSLVRCRVAWTGVPTANRPVPLASSSLYALTMVRAPPFSVGAGIFPTVAVICWLFGITMSSVAWAGTRE